MLFMLTILKIAPPPLRRMWDGSSAGMQQIATLDSATELGVHERHTKRGCCLAVLP